MEYVPGTRQSAPWSDHRQITYASEPSTDINRSQATHVKSPSLTDWTPVYTGAVLNKRRRARGARSLGASEPEAAAVRQPVVSPAGVVWRAARGRGESLRTGTGLRQKAEVTEGPDRRQGPAHTDRRSLAATEGPDRRHRGGASG